MRSDSIKLSIIIVTWNSSRIIDRCIDLIHASDKPWPHEIIVFDNASTDDTHLVLDKHRGLRVLTSELNLGFGQGNNSAAKQAKGEYLLFLNPDAYLEDPQALRQLVTALDENPELSGVGPRLVNPDGSHQVGDGGFSPTLGHIAAHQFMLSRFIPGLRGLYISRPSLLNRRQLSVDWIAGTCLLLRSTVFAAAGGFNPEIFMYGEDVELGVKITRSGGKLSYLPQTSVLHLQGATQKSGNEVYVSTKWIDSLFAVQGQSKWPLQLVLFVGFAVRWLLYRARSVVSQKAGDRQRSNAMARYMKHVLGMR